MSRDLMAIFSGIGIIIVIGLLITQKGTTPVLGATFSGLNETIRTLQFQQSTSKG